MQAAWPSQGVYRLKAGRDLHRSVALFSLVAVASLSQEPATAVRCRADEDATALLQQTSSIKHRRFNAEQDAVADQPLPMYPLAAIAGAQEGAASQQPIQMTPAASEMFAPPRQSPVIYNSQNAPDWQLAPAVPDSASASFPGYEDGADTISTGSLADPEQPFIQDPAAMPSQMDQGLQQSGVEWTVADMDADPKSARPEEQWSMPPRRNAMEASAQGSQLRRSSYYLGDTSFTRNAETASHTADAHLAPSGDSRSPPDDELDLEEAARTMSPEEEYKKLDNLMHDLNIDAKKTGRKAIRHRDSGTSSGRLDSSLGDLSALEQTLNSAAIGKDNFQKMLDVLSPTQQEREMHENLAQVLGHDPKAAYPRAQSVHHVPDNAKRLTLQNIASSRNSHHPPMQASDVEALSQALGSPGSTQESKILDQLLHRFVPGASASDEIFGKPEGIPKAATQNVPSVMEGLSSQENDVESTHRSLHKGRTHMKGLEKLDQFLESNGLGRITET